MREYVIWGIAPGETDEQPLVVNWQGSPITDSDVAERLRQLCESKLGATRTRVQTIDLSENAPDSFADTWRGVVR